MSFIVIVSIIKSIVEKQFISSLYVCVSYNLSTTMIAKSPGSRIGCSSNQGIIIGNIIHINVKVFKKRVVIWKGTKHDKIVYL